MKSPWKFLRDLASGGTATEQAKSAPDIESKTPEARPAPVVEALIASIAEAVAPTDTVANESANDRIREASPIVDEPAGPNAPSTDLTDDAPANDQENPSEDTPIKRQTRLKRSIARNVARATRVEYGSGTPAPAPQTTFCEEVLALDEDIRQLRRQLAEKLSLQNAQLKKMLERF